ncbi:MAG: hypothetical protein HOQ03_10935 [Thermoleophilia bacterium]|nr:hypothetical protein [Thermoleophilia bacterium]
MSETPQAPRFAARSASFIGLMLLAGRVLERLGAFGQILLIAAFLGSTTRADLYFIASIVPLTLGNVVGEALAAAVLPRAARDGEEGASRIFSAGLWIAAVTLTGLTLLYLVAVAIFVPRTMPAGTASLLPWLAYAPLGVFFGLGSYCAAPLLHYERYAWPALRGATATIVGFGLSALVLALGGGVVWIGLAISTGYGIALLLLLAELASIGRAALLRPPRPSAVGDVLALWRKLAASAASGVIGGQVFVLIERILTAPLGVGAVASISYARGVAYTPAILGQSIAAGVYPSVLRAHAAGERDFVRARFLSGLRLTLFVTAVSGAFLALFSSEIASVLFGRDEVTPESLHDVQRSLLAFSLALLGWMLTIYGSRLFGALDVFRGLILQEIVALAVYLAIVFPLREGFDVPGVALAFGIGQVAGGIFGMALVAVRLRVRSIGVLGGALAPAVVRSLPVVLALVAVKLGLDASAGTPDLVVAMLGALTAATMAFAALWRADWEELDSVRGFLRARRRPAAAPE